MVLGSGTFDAVIRSLESDGPLLAGGNRREPRVALRQRLTILPCPDGLDAGVAPPLSVPVRDLSRGGVRFLLPRRLALDTQFVLLLPRPLGPVQAAPVEAGEPAPQDAPVPTVSITSTDADGSQRCADVVAVLCTVTYWQPLAKELFAIGGQFVEVLQTLRVPTDPPRMVLPGQTADDGVPQRAAC